MIEAALRETFSYPSSAIALSIIGRSAAVYLCVVTGLRILGKHQLGQMNVYDLVLIIVIANAVQNAMVGNDTTLFGGLLSALTLLLMNKAVILIVHHNRMLGRYMIGEAVPLIENGRIMDTNLKSEGVTEEELLAALREYGVDRTDEVLAARLEVDGSISVIQKGKPGSRRRRRFKALRSP